MDEHQPDKTPSDEQMTEQQRERDQRNVDLALADELEEDRRTEAQQPRDDPRP